MSMNGNELRRLWPGNQSPASQGPGERVPGPVHFAAHSTRSSRTSGHLRMTPRHPLMTTKTEQSTTIYRLYPVQQIREHLGCVFPA